MNKLLYLIVALAALAVGIFGYQKSYKLAQPEHALYYQQARDINPFVLEDHLGAPFSNQHLENQWSWVFFGYTSCPDVCPTTLQEFNFINDELKNIAENTQVLLVTVDPNRDTQEKLAQYIGYFNKEFKALRAGHGILFPFARNLGLMYAMRDDDESDGYLVDHSASIVLINPQGKVAAIFKPKFILGQPPTIQGSELVSDFEKIVSLNK